MLFNMFDRKLFIMPQQMENKIVKYIKFKVL